MAQIADAINTDFLEKDVKTRRDLFICLVYRLVDADTSLGISFKNIRDQLSMELEDNNKIISFLKSKNYIDHVRLDSSRNKTMIDMELYTITIDGIEYSEKIISTSHPKFMKPLNRLHESIDKNNLITRDKNIFIEPNNELSDRSSLLKTKEEDVDERELDEETSISSEDDNYIKNRNESTSIGELSAESINDKQVSIENDLLNYSYYSEALVDFIAHEKFTTPFSICITGDWGSGKSSVMNWIKESLERKKFKTFWFNAWMHSNDEEIWVSFATEFSKAIIRENGKVALTFSRIKDKVGNYVFNFDTLIIFLLALAIIITCYNLIPYITAISPMIDDLKSYSIIVLIPILYKFFSPPIQKMINKSRRPDFSKFTSLKTDFINEFRDLVKYSTKDKPYIIFIDDLDRAPPPIAANIIEAISLILENKKCVFIFAFDPTIVYASIETKYSKVIETLNLNASTEGKFKGRNFVEKFFQLSVNLPELSQSKSLRYMERLLGIHQEVHANGKINIGASASGTATVGPPPLKEEDGKKSAAYSLSAESGEYSISNELSDEQKKLVNNFEEIDEVKHIVSLSADLLPGNPRKLKRFLNVYRFTAYLANRKGLFEDNQINLNDLGVIVIASLEFQEIYKIFSSNIPGGWALNIFKWTADTNNKLPANLIKFGLNESHRNNKTNTLCSLFINIDNSKKDLYLDLMI